MHLYLDTGREIMTIWPIYGFPLDQITQSIDHGKLRALSDSVLELLASMPMMTKAASAGTLDAERSGCLMRCCKETHTPPP